MKVLRDRRLAALLGAEVVSSLGTQMTWLALPWFVLRTTGSAERMTWVIIAEVLPIAVLGFWGGAIAARVGTRRTMLTCDFVRVPIFAAIPALHAAGALPFPALLALVASSGLFLAPYFSVQRSVVPELIGEEHADVAEATAFFQAANRLTIFLGPPAAGILIGWIGTADVLYVDAATYLASFVLVATFVNPPEVRADGPPTRMLDGVRFLMRDRLLRIWTPAFTLIDVCWQLLFASLPVLVVSHFDADPRVLGWLFGAFGGGALVGAFTSMPLVSRVEALALGATAFVVEVMGLWLLAVPGSWVVAFSGLAVAGFATSIVNAPMQALVMLRIPRELRTQAMSAFAVFQCIGSPIGLIAAGWALARYDTRSVLAVVLALFTVGAAAFVAASLAERATLRAASVDSPA
ncbi:MAG TPA: MFS transporter [Gaiellaceae bacterium]|nr:MFS transporter [Gaiellaceae bacterium]